MLIPHPVFETPEGAQLLWRYMDLSQYLALLSNSSLHFTRADKFEDKWEGEYTKPNVEGFKAAVPPVPGVDMHKTLFWFGKAFKNLVFVNCWHESDHESAAMWKLYGNEGSNVALVTTVERLSAAFKDSTKPEIMCGRVKYLDYAKDNIPMGNALTPFLRKRKSFSFESEVRLLVLDAPEGEELKITPDHKPAGIDVKAHLPTMIVSVLISPKSPTWFVNTVKDVTQKYGLNPDMVVRSQFDEGPLY